jgi:hypothetical protein
MVDCHAMLGVRWEILAGDGSINHSLIKDYFTCI